MRTKYFNLTIVIFSGVTLVIFVVLAVITVRDSIKYNVLIDRNSLKQGYWIIKSLEFIYSTENENRDYLIQHAMVTNIASRLCDLGTKGDIHLSATTAQLVRDHVTLQKPFDAHLKNIPGVVPVYKLT